MATVVAKTGIKREKGWLYYLDKRGDVSRAKMARGGRMVLVTSVLGERGLPSPEAYEPRRGTW